MNIIKLLNIPTKKNKYGLEKTHRLLKECKLNDNNFIKIQIIGTNGKGSVAAFLSKALFDAGFNLGVYSSPHLVKINERIQVNREQIQDSQINCFLSLYSKQIKKIKPSFFEIMTVLSIWYFTKKKIDIAILETGLGGRLDSVTACNNQILLFTSISMDHHDILGNTLEKIAKEKSGAILNQQQICISVYQEHIVKKILKIQVSKHNNQIIILDQIKAHKPLQFRYLYGNHQIENVALVKETIKIISQLKKTTITAKQINKSIYNTQWSGRFQIICQKPKIIYDVAHNKASLNSFIDNFTHYIKNKKYNKKHLICAFENNKRIFTTLKKYEKHFNYIICTETQIRASMDATKITRAFLKKEKTQRIHNIDNAILKTLKKAHKQDIIAIIGSHFIAPALNRVFKNCFAPKE